MKNKLNKTICLTLALIIIMTTPLGSYLQGENAKVYAVGTEIENAMAQFMFPIVAYVATQQLQANGAYSSAQATAQDIADMIDTMNDAKSVYFSTLAMSAKIKLAKLYTDLSNYDINKMFGTTYSDTEMSHIDEEVNALRSAITNNEPLTNKQFYELGIHSILSNFILNSKKNFQLSSNSTLILENGISYNNVDTSTIGDIRFRNIAPDMNFMNLLSGYKKIISEDWSYMSYYFMPSYNFTYITQGNIINISFEKLDTANVFSLVSPRSSKSNPGYFTKENLSVENINLIIRVNDSIIKNIPFRYSENTTEFLSINTLHSLLNTLNPYTANDLTKSDYYLNAENYDIWDLFLIGNWGSAIFYSPDVYAGQNAIGGLFASVIEPGTAADTSLTQAEKVIGNKTDSPVAIIDNNIQVQTNPITGEPEIVIIPSDTNIGQTSTADNPSIEDNPGGVMSDGGAFNIPILGTILTWLKAIWDMLKSIFDSITNQFANTGDSGIDWGNFKGFFDIFYIFYYLIIIVILILLKFLVAVFNMLNISANTALFDQYPTMLSGINYLKNLKVGGFNITIQQIFEYMFTIFFFLFIVTVLQKLYHGFTNVERQQLRQNSDIKLDTNSYKQYTNIIGSENTSDINKHYSEYSSFNQEVFNRETYGNKGKSDILVNLNENINYQDLTK